MNFKTTIAASLICAGLFSQTAQATIVKLETNVGDLYINLYDETTPITVANFLAYVNDGRYDNTFIHRAESGFVIQGGGFIYSAGRDLDTVETYPAVTNEPKLSNVRGTISMAKISGQPNSATSQFFFNLNNNSANLDNAESGYSVFGELTDESMALVDQIAGYNKFNFAGYYNSAAFTNLPLRDYTQADYSSETLPNENNFIIIHTATIEDAATDTAAGLNPPANPNYGNNNNSGSGSDNGSSSGGGGGSLAWLSLALLGLAGRRRIR